MKNIIFILSMFTACFSSCKPERIIQQRNDALFKESTINRAGLNNTFIVDNSNTREAKSKMLREILSNKLPTSSLQSKYPTWQSYNEFYKTKVQNLSPLTKQLYSELFLSSYSIPLQPNNKELISVVESHIDYLVSQNYRGYKLLYETMVWLKNNGEMNFLVTTKTKIEAYAKPMNVPDPNKHDNKMVLDNEKLKNELDQLLTTMKENDSYILKIQELSDKNF